MLGQASNFYKTGNDVIFTIEGDKAVFDTSVDVVFAVKGRYNLTTTVGISGGSVSYIEDADGRAVLSDLNQIWSGTFLGGTYRNPFAGLANQDKIRLEGEEGFRIAKVRIREERIPAIGDKFCSRCGQKGTVGLVIPEENMPFTKNGVRPDIIVNPHALPSRMTLGQMMECIVGKCCLMEGVLGDCTAFLSKGPKDKIFGNMLFLTMNKIYGIMEL